MGQLRVRRVHTGWRDRARSYRVLVDGAVVGRVANGAEVVTDASAGTHEVRAAVGRWWSSRPVTVDVPAEGVTTVSVKARPMQGGVAMSVESITKRRDYVLIWVGGGDEPPPD